MSESRGTVWSFGGGGGSFSLPDAPRAQLMLVSPVTERDDVFAASMAVAIALAGVARPVLICEPRSGRRRLSGAFSTALSRGVGEIVAARYPELSPAARGPVCHLGLSAEPGQLAEKLGQLAAALPVAAVCIAPLPAAVFREFVEDPALTVDTVVLLADLPRDRALTALTCGEMQERGIRCRVWKTALKGPRKQLVMAGLAPGGAIGTAADRLVRGLDSERRQ